MNNIGARVVSLIIFLLILSAFSVWKLIEIIIVICQHIHIS